MKTNPSVISPPSGVPPAYQRLKSDMLAVVEQLRALRPSTCRPPIFAFQHFNFSPPPFPIAGFRYYDGDAALPELLPGTTLTLRAQPDNPHDVGAVEILHRGRKLGYVPRFCNRRVSQLLQDEAPVMCEVARISADAPPWDAVAVRVSVSQDQLIAA